MRMQRSVQILGILTTFTALAACQSYGSGRMHEQPTVEYSATVAWDSGPLDSDYQRQRSDMETRHTQEIAAPRDGESGDQMKQRHSNESKDLDDRYEQGKTQHAKAVPSGRQERDDQKHGDDKPQDDKSHL